MRLKSPRSCRNVEDQQTQLRARAEVQLNALKDFAIETNKVTADAVKQFAEDAKRAAAQQLAVYKDASQSMAQEEKKRSEDAIREMDRRSAYLLHTQAAQLAALRREQQDEERVVMDASRSMAEADRQHTDAAMREMDRRAHIHLEEMKQSQERIQARERERQAERAAAAGILSGFAGLIAGRQAQAAVEGAFDAAKAVEMWARYAASWGTDTGALLAAGQYTLSAAEMFAVAGGAGSGSAGGGTTASGGTALAGPAAASASTAAGSTPSGSNLSVIRVELPADGTMIPVPYVRSLIAAINTQTQYNNVTLRATYARGVAKRH